VNNAYGIDCPINATNVYETGLIVHGWNLESCGQLAKISAAAAPVRLEHNRLSFNPLAGKAYLEVVTSDLITFSDNKMYIPLTGTAVYDFTASPNTILQASRNIYVSVGDPGEIKDYFLSGTAPRNVTAIDDFMGPGCHYWDRATNGGAHRSRDASGPSRHALP